MSEIEYFSEDHSQAQRRFRRAVERAGGELIALPIVARGPAGERLAIDVGWLGAPRPRRVFVHSCGVHGVEAFAGSAIQLAWLDATPARPPEDAAIALVHPVNPFGMAHRRRANEQNVDLNRNCLRPGEVHAGAPAGYRAVNGFLNPDSLPMFDPFLARTLALIARHGFAALKQSVAEGQYEFPRGLFFGGRSLEEGPRRLLSLMTDRLAAAEHLVALDVHTGLGRYGRETVLLDPAVDAGSTARLRALFGTRVAALDPRQGPAYTPRGLYETVFHLAAPRATRLCAGQEFGTFSPLRMLKRLRRENYEFHHRAGGVAPGTSLALTRAFVPVDPAWRASIVRRGVEAIERIIPAFFPTPGRRAEDR